MSEEDQNYFGSENVNDPTEGFFAFNKGDAFNHDALAMLAYTKCINAGTQEMRKGFWQSKEDKMGNPVLTYHPDTRLEFIASVNILRTVLSSNFDLDATTKINNLLIDIKNKKQMLTKQEYQEWQMLPYTERLRQPYVDGMLNQDKIFYQYFINYSVEVYRSIFEELELLLKRSKYLKREMNVRGG